ncbi:tyrosine-type recombinase/integrase [Hydrogenophaga pseudoflava]|uniref:tyrosine-type recombinase/integrase n=1 Tax=Hydrogenophaga pseudoflava TaxID=47421 RepID=UPI0027E5AAAF|nr:integrase arm-type DNA-binding domain-containing protein [Hydrogenophaga pseudoflava]MDQ7745660.1 integrase arm-type DNA-binding domain-containing protein [Hydrogenophaga pseudoflava]
MLTDLQCKNATCPPDKKHARFYDSGGMYLQVSPAGSKRWFWKYRIGDKEKQLALGSYPAVGLMAARKARDAAKVLKDSGQDPVSVRQAERNPPPPVPDGGDSFRLVALEWYRIKSGQWSDVHAERMHRQFERDLFPWIGDRGIASITRVELLACLRKIEERGAIETADRALMLCGQVWRYAMATGRTDKDVTIGVKDALTPYRGKHFAAITEPADLGTLLRAIQAYRGGPIVRAALQLAPMLFQRPGELRGAAWGEMDLDGALWTIPAMRMKRNKEGKEHGEAHLVPLPRQAVEILRELHRYTGHHALVFPGERARGRPISENSVRTALISMGYTPDKQTWHGFRATARTMLAERLEFDPLVIEAQLAHGVRDANGRAYNRTTYLAQRTAMMQAWADYLDKLKAGADVVKMARRAR